MATIPKSLYQFLNEQIVEIPILQRDYAQGRKGKEALRRTFLSSLKKALDDAIECNNNKPLQLDFVYGSTNQGVNDADAQILQPLDGQQRLTTLWLLHWYIALRAGKLEEASTTLKRFSYETRISSRAFCYKLCEPKNFETFKMPNELGAEINDADGTQENTGAVSNNGVTNKEGSQTIAEYIATKTWFYTKWKQDPTIQSMLRMLSGDKEDANEQVKRRINKKDLQINFDDDAIEKIFALTPKADFIKYWELLTSNQSPIVFYHLPLKKFGLSDDLYVKMNARGKALTPFENFKADLIGYMRQQRDREKNEHKLQGETTNVPSQWEKIVDPRVGVPILLDTTWANLFWKYRSKINEIDEAFLSFLNRYFWNELILTNIPLENNPSYIHLNIDNGKFFDDFTPYLYDNGEIPISFFENLKTVMERFGKLNCTYDIPNQGQFNYRPIYITKTDKDKVQCVDEITLPGRILFFAITKYFKDGEYDKSSFDRWIRVVGNLISGVDENGKDQIRSIEQVRNVIHKLNTLNSHNIYENLLNPEISKDVPNVIEDRFKEEVEKAHQIMNDDRTGLRDYPNEDFETWEEAIKHYETFSFFKGCIRFLYRDQDGNPLWDDFAAKSKVAEKYFSKVSGVYLNFNEEKESFGNPSLLKILYSYTDKEGFWQAVWWRYRVFSNKDSSWLHLLKNPKMANAVHHLLKGYNINPYDNPKSDDFAIQTLYFLSQTKLLNYVAEKIPDSWIRDYHNHRAIFPSATGIFLNAYFRDDFLQNTEEIELLSDCKVEDSGLLFGSNIDFTYNKYKFSWYDSDKIYLTTGLNLDRLVRDANGKNDAEKYYMFNAKDINDKKQILESLDILISECKI